ncbi:hypothetical protein [Algoriphagus jejuensis]|uniref:hypothetical protein n=1 Tax=Algoriphagus jejuensis TaxID=419934 RepID=UPI0031E38913
MRKTTDRPDLKKKGSSRATQNEVTFFPFSKNSGESPFKQKNNHTMYPIQTSNPASSPPTFIPLKSIGLAQFELETMPFSEADHRNEFYDLYRMELRWREEGGSIDSRDIVIISSQD